ncbi:MAG: LuxR family transcriptional regulator [Alphaproteobacteria bacterium]|nr:LuxR family transcriptional regulator [Alphaproteobacteria bacterium SS10]
MAGDAGNERGRCVPSGSGANGSDHRQRLSDLGHLARESLTWLERLEAAETMDDLTTAYGDIVSGLGFGYHSYVALEHIPRVSEPLPFFVSTLPDEFLETYNEARFLSVDPVLRMAFNYNAPFGWYDCREYQQARRYSRGRKTKAREILELSHNHNLYNGLIIPNHTPNPTGTRRGRSSFVSLYWTDGAMVDEDGIASWEAAPGMKVAMHALNATTLFYHDRMLSFRTAQINNETSAEVETSLNDRPGTADKPVAGSSLSERELDCLNWAAQGKTTEETGKIMGITTHSVHSYLKTAAEKLDATRTVQAVALAINQGLILH